MAQGDGVAREHSRAGRIAWREQLWERIWKEMRPRYLRDYTRVIGLGELSQTLDAMLERRTTGRILLQPDAASRSTV